MPTNGLGSYNFAVKGDGIQALQTNGNIGIRSQVYDGQIPAFNTNGNYETIGIGSRIPTMELDFPILAPALGLEGGRSYGRTWYI